MPFDKQQFDKYRKGEEKNVSNLLAIPIEDMRMVGPPRNRNVVIKDMETEILNMRDGGWQNLSEQEKAILRRQAQQR